MTSSVGEGIEKRRLRSRPQHHVRGLRRDAHPGEQARPVRSLAAGHDVPQMVLGTQREVEGLQPAVAADVHQADRSHAALDGETNQVVGAPLLAWLADLPLQDVPRLHGRIAYGNRGSGPVESVSRRW